jgi:hypothetical protein
VSLADPSRSLAKLAPDRMYAAAFRGSVDNNHLMIKSCCTSQEYVWSQNIGMGSPTSYSILAYVGEYTFRLRLNSALNPVSVVHAVHCRGTELSE